VARNSRRRKRKQPSQPKQRPKTEIQAVAADPPAESPQPESEAPIEEPAVAQSESATFGIDPIENIESLQKQIAELEEDTTTKDDLVAVLTEQLEKAVEQLDRLQQADTESGNVAETSDGSSEAILQEQRKLSELVKHATQKWQAADISAVMRGLGVQLDEIHALIRSDSATGAWPAANAKSISAGDSTSANQRDTQNQSDDEFAGDSWENLKARYFTDTEHDVIQDDTESEVIQDDMDSETVVDDVTETVLPNADLEPVDPPQPIDFDVADLDQLQQAIDDRDAYISYVLKKLRNAAVTICKPVDWDAIQNAPEELCERLENLEQQLNENMKLAEIDLSLERARLGREEARLAQQSEQIERKLKQIGLSPDDELEDASSNGKQTSRWLRFLNHAK